MKYLKYVFSLGLGALIALIFSLHSSTQTSAHLTFEEHTTYYSHSDSNCWNFVDPVSVVFHNDATEAQVDTHARHHGDWGVTGGTVQWFYDHSCGQMDNDHASGQPYQGRFHMREWWNYDSGWPQYYTLATPHHEDIDWCGDGWKHAVDGNDNEPPGGFVAAKWDIGYNWHNWNNGGGDHWFSGNTYYGGNTIPFEQCNGDWAWNDGWIDFVEIWP
jgi:hypothetical protein